MKIGQKDPPTKAEMTHPKIGRNDPAETTWILLETSLSGLGPKITRTSDIRKCPNMLSLLDFKYHLKYCGHPKDVWMIHKVVISCYAPNFEKVGDILVSACPYVCMYVRTYSCSRYRLETSCIDSSWKNSRRIFLVFPELSPLVKLRPFDKQGDEIL